MPRDSVIKLAKRQLARLDARISAFVRKYESGEREIENIILRAILEGNLWRMRDRRRLRAEAQTILRELYRERDAAIDPLVVEHFDLGRRVAEAGLRESISQSSLQKEALRILIENAVVDLGSALDTVGRRVEDVFRKEGLRAGRDRAAGDEEVKVSKTMRERLIRQGVTSFIDASGRRWSLVDYTRMSVKTVTSEAQNRATELVLLERGFDVVEINSVLKPCKVCLPFNGEVVSLTGKVPGVMHLKKTPPFHPECRHFIFPNSRTIEEREQRLEVASR